MITSMSVQNFKSWKKTGNIQLAPITGFFGSNSSGKTSLLQLLLMLKSFTVEEYVAWWLRELNLIHAFTVEPITEGSNLYQVKVQRTPGSAKVLITDVGFGVSQILPVLTLCYYVPEASCCSQ